MGTTQSDIFEMVSIFLTITHGQGVAFEIAITTKRKPNEDKQNLYRMLVTKNGQPFLKSKEIPGWNKSRWSGKEWGILLGTLKPVNQEENV